jgi:uncharacterized SAM-binding protein YcdF (DUF218 family)
VARSRSKLLLLSLVALLVVVFLFVSCQVARRIQLSAAGDPLRKADAIVVFGAAEYSGHPSPVLKARLDHALELFDQGWAPIVITTGGAGLDPVYSEGGVGRDYLTRHGVPDVNLIGETQSVDTAESAERVGNIMLTNHLHSALVVSDAYHMFRIKRMMRKAGVEAIAAPRPDSLPKTAWGRFEGVSREVLSFWAWKLHIT